MPFDHLEITIGGLCMYVNRPDGLYVLMPNMQHELMMHCPMLIAHRQNSPTRRRRLYPLQDQDWSVVYNRANPGPSNCSFLWALNVSNYTNHQRVEPRFITAPPQDCLASRIRLPTGYCPQPQGNPANFVVEGHGNVTAYGKATLTIPIRDPANNTLVLPNGEVLTADNNNRITIQLLNIPWKELDRTKGRRHMKYEESHHVQAYYWLLQGHCPTLQGGPRVIIDDNPIGGDPQECYNDSCFSLARDLVGDGPDWDETNNKGTPRIFWVDTYTCSSGTADG